MIDALLEESPAADAAEGQGETLARRAARVAHGRTTETLAQRAARIAQSRGIRPDAIDLGDPAAAPAAPAPVAPTPIRLAPVVATQPEGTRAVVRVGKPVGVGVPEETIVRARSGELGLAPAIQASLSMAHLDPAAADQIQRKVNRIRAPGTASTAANIALSNVAAPLFPKAADAATDAALERFTAGGGKPADHADLFGAAGMGGEIAGGAALGAATAPAAPVAAGVLEDALPAASRALGRTVVGRVAKHAVTGALVNAPIGAVTGAAESDAPDIGGRARDAVAGAGHAAAAGAIGGAFLGGASEGVGALAERAARIVEERRLAERTHDTQLPAVLDRPGVNPPAPPSNAALAARREVDAAAKTARPTPVPAAVRDPAAASVAYAEAAHDPAIAPDLQAHAAARANALQPDSPPVKPGPNPRVRVRAPEPEATTPAADAADAPSEADAPAGDREVVEMHAGLPITKAMRVGARNAFRSAFVTPYAEIEQEAPELAATLNAAGAATKRAEHISDRRLPLALEGLTEEQRGQFGTKLVHDNMIAEAERKGQAAADLRAQHRAATIDDLRAGMDGKAAQLERDAASRKPSDGAKYAIQKEAAELRTAIAAAKSKADFVALADQHFAQPMQDAADRFTAHAGTLAQRLPADVEREPWFTGALDKYKTSIEAPLREDALRAGVDPAAMRAPATAYVRLASEQRLDDAEIRRAMQIAGVTDASKLSPRSPALRALIGENPTLARYYARNADGPRQGPLRVGAGASTTPRLGAEPKTSATGSAQMATGSAQSYATDLDRIVQMDAHDKAVKAARNRVWEAVSKVGRPLEAGESTAPGKKVLSFTDTKGLATGETGVHRVEVTPAVYDAVTRFHQGLEGRPESAAKRMVRSAGSVATRAQISGMPVEATSHMNTLASIVASVPGEKDLVGKALAAVPGQGAKAAAIREMLTIDFHDPATRALENRLADAGALRIEPNHGGLINSSHHALFGPEGVDARGRLVLARKLFDRDPNATNEQLREFITGKLGNYVKENSGAVTNALQDSGLSAFARFQAARIPTSVKAAFGESGLPTTSSGQRIRDVASTLYRGPVGHLVGTDLLNRAITGHSAFDNEKGHNLDVDTGLYAVDGTIKHLSPDEAKAYGDKASPLYIPGGTLNPVAVGGLRSSGLKAILLSDRTGPGRMADVLRDYTNSGLGVISPFGRALFSALTGRVPYVAQGGDFMKTTDAGFDKDREQGRRIKAAVSQMNPALHAFAETGGGGRTLGQALEHGDAPLGGFAAGAAKTAEFIAPRLLTPGVGGRTNEQSVAARDQREFKDAMTDYTRRVRSANSPRDALTVIDEAASDAQSDGRFDPEVVRRQLRRALLLGPEPAADDQARLEENEGTRQRVRTGKRDIGSERFSHRVRIRPTANDQ